MAPSVKELREALVDGTCHIFSVEPDTTSVNKVRRHVEDKLELEEGFFTSDEWKQNSKTLIKEHVEKLLDGWTPEAKKEPESKNGIKRQSDAKSPEPKRRKRATKPVKAEESELSEEEKKPQPKKRVTKPVKVGSSELSDLSDEEERPKPRKRATKPVKSESSELSDLSEEEKKPKVETKAGPRLEIKKRELEDGETTAKKTASPKRDRKLGVKDESEDDKDEIKGSIIAKQKPIIAKQPDSSDEEEKTALKKQEDSDDDTKPAVEDEDSKPVVDEEEEYSDVLDEAPQPKRRKKDKKDASKPAKASKSASKSKVVAKSAPTPDDPDEAEIKKLQSHLAKCGIRKLWHMELKKYGDDARAKIRHLRKMLAEIGMDGRFSEAKAREVKETRELLAEAEAAQEMNALWGMNSGGRASRSKSTTKIEMKDESDEEQVKDEDEDDEKEPATFGARRRRADLAFLGDDSDSD